jgi:hypothetical protein
MKATKELIEKWLSEYSDNYSQDCLSLKNTSNAPLVDSVRTNQDILSIDDNDTYFVADHLVIFDRIVGNLAKVDIVNDDLSQSGPFYLVRSPQGFAFDDTAHHAADKLEMLATEEDFSRRCEIFIQRLDLSAKYSGWEFVHWHRLLFGGTCNSGVEKYSKMFNIDLDAEYTVGEYIDIINRTLTGSSDIQELKNYYENFKSMNL